MRLCSSLASVMAADSKTGLTNGNAQSDPKRTYQVVVAATRDMGIGKDGKLPWRLPTDLKFFKDITLTTLDSGKKNAVIMGRKTWESIPLEHRPLPGRLNVVLTRSGSFDIATAENVVICGSMGSALELLAASPYCLSIEKVFVIGGGQIFRYVPVDLWPITSFRTACIDYPFFTGKHLMILVVMLSTLLKSRQALNVTLLCQELICQCINHGILHFQSWKTIFDFPSQPMFV